MAWTAAVWSSSILSILSQSGQLAGVEYSHAAMEHLIGVGAMVWKVFALSLLYREHQEMLCKEDRWLAIYTRYEC